MSKLLTIRAATMDDFEAICPLLRELDEYHVRILPGVFQPIDDAELQRERIARFVENDEAELFLAASDDEIVGLVTIRIADMPDAPMFLPDRRACIEDLVVSSASRGQGIGKRLLAHVSEWARGRQLQSIDINVWSENKMGVAFYQSHGFQPRCQKMELRINREA